MDQTTGLGRDGQQIAAAMAAEYESLSPRCRADAACLGRRRTGDGAWQIFHHQGTPAAG